MRPLILLTLLPSLAFAELSTDSSQQTSLFGDAVDAVADPTLALTTDLLAATLQLSSDIGAMADRIGEMSDRIGVMADRIVATEELMAQLLVTLTERQDGGEIAAEETLLLAPKSGDQAWRDEAPTITLASGASRYLLYASTTPTFESGTRLAVLVESEADLEEAWAQAVALGGDEIYLAVRALEGDALLTLSNGARVEILDVP